MKRALLIGSQTGGLAGVHADVELMDATLTGLGFTTVPVVGRDATTAEIVARYRGLIEDTGDGDAAVVYFSGHGGRIRDPAPSGQGWLQFIVPTDADRSTAGDARVILAEELQLLQLQLTAKSPNVTTVLDCCHSARMSRDATALPKADPRVVPDPASLRARRAAALADPVAATAQGDSNPLAVRVVGCSPDQSSFELPSAVFGGRRHGALTAALAPVLSSPAAAQATWRDVMEIVRRQVLDLVPGQRPETEGPADRLVFSLETRSASGVLHVRVNGGTATIDDASLFGVAVGDTYAIVVPGATAADPVDTAEVVHVSSGRAVLRTQNVPASVLPAGCAAWPLRVSLGSRPVLVLPPTGPGRDALVAAIERSPYARVAESDAPAFEIARALATVRMGPAGVDLVDSGGQQLYRRPVPASAALRIAADVTALAAATHVRELASGSGTAELTDDVPVEVLRLTPDRNVAVAAGDHLFVGDRIMFRSTNDSGEPRYVSILDVGVTGRVTVLNSAEPDGTTLAVGETRILGADFLATTGFELFWPDGVPDAAPRQETFVVIVSDRKIDGLTRLEQEGVVSRSATGARSELERLVDAVASGRRDARPQSGGVPLRYRVACLDVVFHPTRRRAIDEEPSFTVDERPNESFRFVVPRGTDVPRRVAVRLKELTVRNNRSFLAARVRVDALLVTSVASAEGAPYAAGTVRFDRVRDGDRLPFDDLLLYEGPVNRFVDLAVWVSRDDSGDRDLADLLVAELDDTQVAGALTALAGLAVAAPLAAAAVGAVAAVSVLVRTAARVIDKARGTSIGAYRTSLLPHQRFGAKPPGRHPAQGLIDAQDISFAYEIIDVDPT